MSGNFTIETDVARDLVRIQLGGFFTEADIHDFLVARNAAHAKLTCGRNQHLTLTDIRGMKIQAQDAVDGFRTLLADPAHRSRRLAFVVSPTLARSQLGRALGSRDARFFQTIVEAEAWLFSGVDQAAA